MKHCIMLALGNDSFFVKIVIVVLQADLSGNANNILFVIQFLHMHSHNNKTFSEHRLYYTPAFVKKLT